MSASDANSSSYKLTNLVGNFSIPLINNKKSGHKLIEIKMGLGASPSTIGDFNKILLSIPIDINYYLPINFKGFGLALNLHAQETLGIPTDIGTEDTKATTEFINLGFFITTPLVF